MLDISLQIFRINVLKWSQSFNKSKEYSVIPFSISFLKDFCLHRITLFLKESLSISSVFPVRNSFSCSAAYLIIARSLLMYRYKFINLGAIISFLVLHQEDNPPYNRKLNLLHTQK